MPERAADRREIEILDAASPTEIALVRELFFEYQRSIGVDLCFQGFSDEVAALPGAYAPPSGRLLLAGAPQGALGCVALRGLGDGGADCEMKRLYVRPAAQGLGLGRRLAEAVVSEAKAIGYRRVCLDTLPSMQTAQRLYLAMGFRDIAPYTANPVAGARFMGLAL